MVRSSARRRPAESVALSDNEAATAIQAWFQGNAARMNEEQKAVLDSVDRGENGAAGFQETTSLRRRGTVKFNKVLNKMDNQNLDINEKQVFFMEEKFSSTLKGIIDVQARITEPFTLMIVLSPRIPEYDQDMTKYSTYFALNVDYEKAWFTMKRDGREDDLVDQTEVIMHPNTELGLEPDTITTYWLSYDRDNMVVKYGKGYAMEETTLLVCDFSEDANTAEKLARKRKQWRQYFALYDPQRLDDITILLYRTPADIKKHGEKNVKAGEAVGVINFESMIEVRREPLTANPSPFVMQASKATLNTIDKGQYIFSSELPASCRILYETVINCNLDMEWEMGGSEVKLSDAIRYSIETPGAMLYNKLQTKPYLRITMGKARGEAPGVPYVVEIWPVNSRSPIHNHGAVCAIIKVMFGTIQVGVYNKVTSAVHDKKRNFRPTELFKFNAFKDDTTWMSPEWFQTHQLRNVSNDYCATVQCYRYDENDSIQWNMFDYVKDENGEVGNFFPNTDFTFGEMRKVVLSEWDQRLSRR